MKKKHRISAFVDGLATDSSRTLDPCYQGWFTCFNARQYYEAHDVLEHLWLGTRDENHHFYKGLIQIAGAFVHLQKQFLRPDHPKDGRRLRPAVRLFHLGMNNVEPYGPVHLHLEVGALLALCRHYAEPIVASQFTRNPWHPQRAPRVELLA
ncbi:MAG: DUF309 domain-containing protein [Verrucomicrobiota bacterium]|nr:DUF309 domain-containing protein [Verrucomicrobiota bacterium]